MGSLALGLGTFALLLAVQVAVWRLRRPAGQYVALGALAVAVPAVAVAALATVLQATPVAPRGLFDYLNGGVLYVALMLAWVTTYSAVQADSPTMSILLIMERAGEHGVTVGEILAELDDTVLVLPRLDDLVRGGLVSLGASRYRIRPRGALMARVHVAFRALLGYGKGG